MKAREIGIGALISAAATAAIVAALEIVAACLESPTPRSIAAAPLNLLAYDSEIGGHLPKKNAHLRASLTFPDGRPCYDVQYDTDGFGRRISPGQAHYPSKPYLVLFGCSYVWGTAIDVKDTLASQLAGKMPGVDMYNYGIPGGGPSHMLRVLQKRNLRQELESTRGAAVYVIQPFHISRVIGDAYASWLIDYGPAFRLDAAGRLEYAGAFRHLRPIHYFWLDLFANLQKRSHLVRYLQIGAPLRYTDSDIELTARVLIYGARTFVDDTKGAFFVAFPPSWYGKKYDRNTARAYYGLIRTLRAANLPLLDYSESRPRDDMIVKAGCDSHPNGAFNRMLAEKIAADLGPFFQGRGEL